MTSRTLSGADIERMLLEVIGSVPALEPDDVPALLRQTAVLSMSLANALGLRRPRAHIVPLRAVEGDGDGMPRLVRTPAAAKMLGMSASTLKSRKHWPDFKSMRVDNGTRFDQWDVDKLREFVQRRRLSAGDP